jgi:hypothetical protein
MVNSVNISYIGFGIISYISRNINFKVSVVSYNGVTDIITKDFNDYISNDNELWNKDDILFLHNKFPQDTEQVKNRISRFINILNTSTEKITFIRNSHYFRHHEEFSNLSFDIENCNKLDVLLQNKYPNLNYEILLFLRCEKCFDFNKDYSSSKNIKIYKNDDLEIILSNIIN